MKKIFILPSLLLSAFLLFFIPVQADAASFKDIPADDPELEEAVQYLTNRNIISGYPDGTFRPENSVTRGHIAKILARALKLDTENVTNPNFSDIPTSHEFYKEIAALANAGIVSGSNGKFNPNQPVTRGQIAKILSNAYNLKATADVELPYTDVAGTGFEQYIRSLYVLGVYRDLPKFEVYQPITRGELAVVIYYLEEEITDGSAVFLAQEFGIDGMHNFDGLYNETSGPVVAEVYYYDYYYQNEELNIVKPVKQGTSYFNLIEFDDNGDLDYSTVVTVQVDVTEGKNGLETKLTKLNTPKYQPQEIYFYELPDKITITDMNNNVIDSKLYPLIEESFEGEVFPYYAFLGENGNYLLKATDKNGERTYAFKHENNYAMYGIELGYYTTENSLHFSKEFLDSRGYVYDEVDYVVFEDLDGIHANKVIADDTGVTIHIGGEEEGEIYFIQDDEYFPAYIRTEKFENGYLVIVDYGLL